MIRKDNSSGVSKFPFPRVVAQATGVVKRLKEINCRSSLAESFFPGKNGGVAKDGDIRDLERRVTAAVARLCPGPTAVAVSGGVDSMVAAEALRRLGKKATVSHVNHRWRGRESDEDERFVREWCKANGLPCAVKRLSASVPRTEAAARLARLAFFAATLKRRKIKTLLLAHHADDLAETFLLRLLRGAGPEGLAGMRERRTLDGMTVVRPLLAFGKAELRRLARHWRLAYREDSSNRSDDYFRNRVRRRLLPYLKKISGRDPLPLLRRTARILADENEFWERELPRVWPARLPARLLAEQSAAWQRRATRAWLAARGVTDADFAQIEAVRDLANHDRPAQVNLSKDRRCRRRGGLIFLE